MSKTAGYWACSGLCFLIFSYSCNSISVWKGSILDVKAGLSLGCVCGRRGEGANRVIKVSETGFDL